MSRPGSGPGERAVRRAYGHLAAHYDARWEQYVGRSVDETLRRMDPPPAGRVLDVGCGTGILLERLARGRPELELVGLDLSLPMLARAEERLRSAAHASLVLGSAHDLPLRGGSFDLVASTSALHFWRRPRRALAEIRRVLRPGGRLVLTDWCRDFFLMRLRDLRFRVTDPAHGRTCSARELEEMLEAVGLRMARLDRYQLPGRWGLMTVEAAPAPARGAASAGRAPP